MGFGLRASLWGLNYRVGVFGRVGSLLLTMAEWVGTKVKIFSQVSDLFFIQVDGHAEVWSLPLDRLVVGVTFVNIGYVEDDSTS